MCRRTITLVIAAFKGWSPSRHWLYHAGVRRAIHTLLLIAQRLQTPQLLAPDATAAAAAAAAAIPTALAIGVTGDAAAAAVVTEDLSSESGEAQLRDGSGSGHGGGNAAALPWMPPEMWFFVMGFVLRQHFAAFEPHRHEKERLKKLALCVASGAAGGRAIVERSTTHSRRAAQAAAAMNAQAAHF